MEITIHQNPSQNFLLIIINGKAISFSSFQLAHSTCYATREAWTSFQGFPKEDAAKAYVYLVTQLQTDLSSGDGKKELSGWGTAVSTL